MITTPDTWQKSSFSGSGDGNNCLELASTPALTPHTIHLRESDTPTTHVTTTHAPLSHLLHAIRSGALATPST